ncbi:DNA-dependent metalloprotease SPRTN isoform X2 [Sphaerodactylus townsendi]|uniref:DNA-dependent metalloprotease SPRTN isoform X2 n=1 Tax=Sphaerodactylus townsendi TaxID=933632 RepID=UPI002026E304|nr:DNA-dependent metalloprotease SPRTN isoform X2 [Sphaerodactylus townsendi]
MDSASDFLLALRLQAEWEAEDHKPVQAAEPALVNPSSQRPLSVVDGAWELLDPSPDVRGLFVQFNESLFWGRLAAVEVKWSPRMTLYGVLGFAAMKDEVECAPSDSTLLHEMIHALLFVTHNNKDHDSHGPEFCKHMHRINRLTGANITIYHEFHDEVDSYRQHWWRCNGPCQNRKPYFGYVKRSMNRAPSTNDFWWSEHQQTCGGTFIKIKEPENYSKKSAEKNQGKILDYNKGGGCGNSKQSVIPFSGKGFVLGERSGGSSLERTSGPNRELLSSQQDSSPGLKVPNVKKEIKFEPSVSCTDTHRTFSCSGKNTHVPTITLPKVSVANTKAYTNVNGSPIRKTSFNVVKSNLFSINAKYISPHVNKTQKRPFPEPTVSTLGCQITSQGNSSVHAYGVSQKQAKIEDKDAFANYFTKKSVPGQSSPTVKAESASCDDSATSASDQTRKVSCPVCNSQVLETKINEHLDSCLS